MLEPPVVPLPDLAARVPDGASVTVHKGDEPDVPMALAKALVRRGVRGLHLVTLPTAAYPASGMMVDLLIGAGCVVSVETSGISLHELGAAPRFTQAVKAGRLKVLDATCPAVYAGLQAGAKGQPFAPLRGLIGSDLVRHRADYRVIDNPFVPGDRDGRGAGHQHRCGPVPRRPRRQRRQRVGWPRSRPRAGRACRQHGAGDGGCHRARQLLRRRTGGRRRGAGGSGVGAGGGARWCLAHDGRRPHRPGGGAPVPAGSAQRRRLRRLGAGACLGATSAVQA
jgi:hypothetical protein